MDIRILDLIATVVEHCEGPGQPGPGCPPAATVRVLATLRRFGREGTPWRGPKATPTQASGSTLRRRLADWAAIDPLRRVHAVPVAMLRGDPDLILDGRSARARRGGDPTGPDPTGRGKRGTEHHVAATGDGVPVACAATAANVNGTALFERLLLTTSAVPAEIGTVFADKGHNAEADREPRRAFGAEPRLHERGRPHGPGLGKRRWPVGRSDARLPENKRSAPRYDRLGSIVRSLLQAACLVPVAGRLAREL